MTENIEMHNAYRVVAQRLQETQRDETIKGEHAIKFIMPGDDESIDRHTLMVAVMDMVERYTESPEGRPCMVVDPQRQSVYVILEDWQVTKLREELRHYHPITAPEMGYQPSHYAPQVAASKTLSIASGILLTAAAVLKIDGNMQEAEGEKILNNPHTPHAKLASAEELANKGRMHNYEGDAVGAVGLTALTLRLLRNRKPDGHNR